MKAILVIDEMPYDCEECPLYDENIMQCGFMKNNAYYVDCRPHDCPLKPLPEKRENLGTAYSVAHTNGWNDCVEELLK